MTEYSENFTSKLDWAMPFQRTGKFPLDRSSMFSSYEDALKYAQQTGDDSRKIGGTSYVGQIITVYGTGPVQVNEDRSTVSPQEVAAYIITAVGENAALQKLAQTTASGDFASDIAALQTAVSGLDARITELEERPNDSDTTYEFTSATTTDGAIRIVAKDKDGNQLPETAQPGEVQVKGWKALNDKVDTAVAAAAGRTQVFVYSNKFDPEYLEDIANASKYKKGDLIYFTDTGISDEWVTSKLAEQVEGSFYTFSKLETEHPDLTQYLKSSDASETYATKGEVSIKADQSAVTTLSGTVTELTGTVAANKTELEGKINKVADDLAKVDVTSQISTEINKLDTGDFGNTNGNFYIKYIKQTDGLITAQAEAMPDVEGIATSKASAAQSAAEQAASSYTDEKIGDIGESETVAQYVDTKTSTVSGDVNKLSGRVLVIENQNLDSRLSAVETLSNEHKNTISDLTTRMSSVEAVATDAQSRVGVVEQVVDTHTTQIENIATDLAARVKTIQLGGVNQTMSADGVVNIASISTDLLVTGTNTLVLDCLNASLVDKA